MTVPLLQRHQARFSERNAFVDALLGALRAVERLEHMVSTTPADPAPEPYSPAQAGAAGDAERARRDDFVHALMGLMVLSAAVRRAIHSWSASAPDVPRISKPDRAAVSESWLR